MPVDRDGIPFRMPAAHPFNPLPLLRLALVFASEGVVPLAIVSRLFRFVWVEGRLPSDSEPWQALLAELGVSADQLDGPAVKAALRSNGERAIAAQVFGVPTAVCDERLFWGFDATDMLIAWLQDDAWFESAPVAQAAQLPVGIERRRG
jgi:2-hydroxychromene-2-carboxylate isomerase